ncbi:hypothetical protein RvY_02381 [Ramazzottius varieornatus]|uniref:PCI domain-containing protein n=1 Tax=Ramazzottius varieornatus TaxID=947166 RepID=A0A1D1UQE3_RAMVA|nr:hypothetical protein RvY_02381 [Ramazzottius varieornatus]
MTAAVEGGSRLTELELLMKNAKGKMVADLIRQITELPDVYRFQKYLSLDNIQELAKPDGNTAIPLLTLFSLGTYKNFKENPAAFGALSAKQTFCLRCLTLASLAKQSTHQKISFSVIQKELDLADKWQVFDFLIEALNYGYVTGKLDEPAGYLYVDEFITRDVAPEDAKNISAKLETFLSACSNMLEHTKAESLRLDEAKKLNAQQKSEIASKVEAVKVQLSDDLSFNAGNYGMGHDMMGHSKMDSGSSPKMVKTRSKSSKSGGQAQKMNRV